jgi:5,10-methenyltetrahydromethanopterin hydrogenase
MPKTFDENDVRFMDAAGHVVDSEEVIRARCRGMPESMFRLFRERINAVAFHR